MEDKVKSEKKLSKTDKLIVEREKMIICVYQYLLSRKNIENIYISNEVVNVANNVDELTNLEIRKVVDMVVNNEINYIEKLTPYLKKGWTFNRLGVLEQAILLVSLAKNKLGEPKAITINEAINLAKKLCDGQKIDEKELICTCENDDESCNICKQEEKFSQQVSNQIESYKFINGVLDKCLE